MRGKDDNGLVYSTATGSQRRESGKKASFVKAAGPAKVRLETKGRGGKAVTVVSDLPLNESEARELLKDLQATFGCGGSLKGSTLELQGDVRERTVTKLLGRGLKVAGH